MNGKGMTSNELSKFQKRHQRHANIQLYENQLQIFLKNSEGKTVDVISLTLNEDMTLHPLQAVDEIITAFQLDAYKANTNLKLVNSKELKPEDKTLEEIEYTLMGLFAHAQKLLEDIDIPYRLASYTLEEPQNEIQEIQIIVLASLIFLFGKGRADIGENIEEYKENILQLFDICNKIAANMAILKEVVKGTIEFSTDMETLRLKKYRKD